MEGRVKKTRLNGADRARLSSSCECFILVPKLTFENQHFLCDFFESFSHPNFDDRLTGNAQSLGFFIQQLNHP